MLQSLKFVRGAVARKDFVPALTHYNIARGRIRGFNGAVALCCPIPLDLEVSPKADLFAKAIEACREVAQLSVTEDKRLFVKSGNFQVFVECSNEPFPNVFPEGDTINLDGNLLEAVKTLAPFIADDASRKWANGILFRGPSAFATNNVILVEYWLGYNFPVEICISKQAVNELLRIGEEPLSLQVSETSVTFHYEGERWLRAQNSPATWPDVGAVLSIETLDQRPFPEGFFSAVDDLAPFVDELGQLFLLENRIATSPADKKGASIDIPSVVSNGIFHNTQLSLLKGIATTIDFSMYPRPCLFYGERTRGAIVGIKA